LYYCYQAEFVLDGVKVSRGLKENGFSIDPDPSHDKRAHLRYDFCMANLSEKEAVDKAMQDVNSFLSFALLGLYRGNGASGFSTSFLKIECTNLEDLIKAKLQLPMFNKIRFSSFYEFQDKTLKGVMDGLKQYSHAIPQHIWIALSFWRTGLSSDEEYARFEYLWKAFEIFHRAITRRNDIEVSSVHEWLAKALSPKDMQDLSIRYSGKEDAELAITIRILGCKSALDCLVKQDYSSKSRSTNYSQNLNDAIINRDHCEILTNAIICLGKLRNNVFHANTFSDKERPLVFVGSSILADILASSFHHMLNLIS
jgi:hypothetical protein